MKWELSEMLEDRYRDLLKALGSRKPQVMAFVSYLEAKTEFFKAPACPKTEYKHCAYEGGLLEHSVNVTENLLGLKWLLATEIPNESCVIVGLFHDLGKAGYEGQPYYLREEQYGAGDRVKNPYCHNPNIVHMDVASRSLFELAKYVELTEEEAQAIRYHDGAYIPENRSVALKECKLTLLLQWADRWSLTQEH